MRRITQLGKAKHKKKKKKKKRDEDTSLYLVMGHI